MTYFNGFLTFVSLVAGLIAIWEVVRYFQDRDRLSWRIVERSMESVIKKMQRMNYKPEMIIGVGRGGAIVGGMLAGNLGHVPFFVVDTGFSRTGGIVRATIRNPSCFPTVEGMDVLVVVGELYSGEDLRAAVDFVTERGAANIATMSLFSHPASAVDPTYVGKETKKPLDAPWRITDEYRTKRI